MEDDDGKVYYFGGFNDDNVIEDIIEPQIIMNLRSVDQVVCCNQVILFRCSTRVWSINQKNRQPSYVQALEVDIVNIIGGFAITDTGQAWNMMLIPPQKLDGFSGAKHGSESSNHVLIEKEDGIYGWGKNNFGQLGGLSGGWGGGRKIQSVEACPSLSIGCGHTHSIIVYPNGVYGCGENQYGQLGLEDLGPKHTLTLLDSLSTRCITAVSCGNAHTLVLTNGGQVLSFGRNDNGQLGLGHRRDVHEPTLIDLKTVLIVEIACGDTHSILLSNEGIIYTFGKNHRGQLGLNNKTDALIPCVIPSFVGKSFKSIAARYNHTACITGVPLENKRYDTTSCNDLASDLFKLVNVDNRSDVHFIVQGQVVYAHRCILMARCEPLERMLNGPMKEGNQMEIDIPEYTYDVFVAFMEYLYTNTVQKLKSVVPDAAFVCELHRLADQYLTDGLKSMCDNALTRWISADTVCDLYQEFSEMEPPELMKELLLEAGQRGVSIK